jgi:hypothetical protein
VISSQLIDNLNASIHLRALLTDIFLISDSHKASTPRCPKSLRNSAAASQARRTQVPPMLSKGCKRAHVDWRRNKIRTNVYSVPA